MKMVILTGILVMMSVTGFAQQNTEAHPAHLYKIGVKDSLYSTILGEERIFWVQHPENFDPAVPRKYPVVYVLDGEVHMKAVSTVLSYYWGGFMPEMIIVGISNRENRTRDLTTSEIEMHRAPATMQESGGARQFAIFIEKELIPYIETNYPATDYRTLIGHSYAGLFAIDVLIHQASLFDNYLVIDPSLDWDHQKLLKQSLVLLRQQNFKGTSLFMSLGGQLHLQNNQISLDNLMEDTSEYTLFARSNVEFSNAVQMNSQNELNYFWRFYQQDLHGTVVLPSILDGMLSLFNWYVIEHTDMFNRSDTPKDELIQIIRNREKKLKDHFGYFVPPFEEDLLNMLGYMNMDWGEWEKSLAFFQLSTEYFPLSANAYDSLADYFVARGDYPNALKNVTKAFEISGDDYHKQRMEDYRAK